MSKDGCQKIGAKHVTLKAGVKTSENKKKSHVSFLVNMSLIETFLMQEFDKKTSRGKDFGETYTKHQLGLFVRSFVRSFVCLFFFFFKSQMHLLHKYVR